VDVVKHFARPKVISARRRLVRVRGSAQVSRTDCSYVSLTVVCKTNPAMMIM
jgi:hypothetical protein